MARTPLFPRGGDFTAWALNVTQRIERDYAELSADHDSLSAAIYASLASVSAAYTTDLHSVSAVIKADISSVSAVITSAIRSLSATLMVRSRHFLNVLDYGADNTGSLTSDFAFSSAIAAMPAAGGGLYIPAGNYKIKTGVTLNKAGLYFGDGYATNIRTSVNNINTFNITSPDAHVREMRFTAGVSLSAGAFINTAASNFRLENLIMVEGNTGINISSTTAVIMTITGIYMYGIKYCGLVVNYAYDLSVNDLILDAPAGSNTRAGIIFNNAGNATFNDVTFIHTDYGVYGAPASGYNISDVMFNNARFDTYSAAAVLFAPLTNASVYRTSFEQCTAMNAGSLGNGFVIAGSSGGTVNGFKISNSQIHNNPSNNIYFNAASLNLIVTGCTLGTSGTGLYADTSSTYFQLVNNRIGPSDGFLSCSTGIVIAAACDNFIVTGNSTLGCPTGINNAAGTGATKIVDHNI